MHDVYLQKKYENFIQIEIYRDAQDLGNPPGAARVGPKWTRQEALPKKAARATGSVPGALT